MSIPLNTLPPPSLGDTPQEAAELASEILLPRTITGSLLQHYFRKALQNHAWHKLPHLHRALLAARTLPQIRSPVLHNLLRQILMEIELATLRGQAVLHGILLALRRGARSLLQDLRSNLTHILYLGISYLNNPPHLRIYG